MDWIRVSPLDTLPYRRYHDRDCDRAFLDTLYHHPAKRTLRLSRLNPSCDTDAVTLDTDTIPLNFSCPRTATMTLSTDNPTRNRFSLGGNGHAGHGHNTSGLAAGSPAYASDTTADATSADQLLEAMGYHPELNRTRSTLQVAFMSFVLASIPYGLATTFFYPLVGGGPANIIWGWVVVSIITLCVAISLGEITSVYPTAGGVYYQTFMLSPPRYRTIASWICGWAYVAGNITITLAVNFGTTLFLVACINVFADADGNPVFAAETYQIFLIFLGITLLCNAVSALGNRFLPILDVSFLFFLFLVALDAALDAALDLDLGKGNIMLTDECFNSADLRHLLDLRRPHRNHHLRPRHREKRPPLRRLRLPRLRAPVRLARRMVLLRRSPASRVRYE